MILFSFCFKDVNSWLVTFGFHLHNTIPGFPVPKFDLSMPSYELQKSQRWDDLPVGKMNLKKQTNIKSHNYTLSTKIIYFFCYTDSVRDQINKNKMINFFHCLSLESVF